MTNMICRGDCKHDPLLKMRSIFRGPSWLEIFLWKKFIFLYMTLDEEKFYIEIVGLKVIYNFVVKSFLKLLRFFNLCMNFSINFMNRP